VSAICEDRLGRLWVGTGGGGVSCFDGDRFTTYTTADGLAHNSVWAICEDREGRLWLGTFGGGVSCFDGEHFTTYTTANGLAENHAWAICEDRQGRLWFGTFGGGVCCFDGERFITYTVEDGLLDNRVTGILQDREGGFWFAQFWSGLTRFDAETVTLLTNQPVSDILIQDGQGRLWFGDESNLICLFEGRGRRQPFAERIIGLLEDSGGRFWIATQGDGLYRYDSASAVWDAAAPPSPPTLGGIEGGRGAGIRHFTPAELGSSLIDSPMEARDGTVWTGTRGSPGCLCRFDGEAFFAIPTPHPVISRLYEDGQGHLWMGGFSGGGLSRYDGEKFVTYTTADGLPDGRVRSIVEDDAGRLWVGTWEGLCCFDGERFIAYGKEAGFFSLCHRWSAKDANGQLWFGTLTGGLYRYDGVHFQWLTTADGLPSDTITGLLPQPDGSMIIGTTRGIVHYRPTATLPPRIEIAEVIADGVYRNPTELELTTTAADLITISYHGLSLATRRMRYSYILEGYHPHPASPVEGEEQMWQDTWERSVRYENLPVGEYTFKVIAINRDLVPSQAPATLKLTIVPDPRDAQIAQLESDLERRNRELEAELQDARQVQMALMPETAPHIEGIEIAGKCISANTVSGDFFDYLTPSNSPFSRGRTPTSPLTKGDPPFTSPLTKGGQRGVEIALVIADVTGKGMKGAMNAVMTDGVLHMAAKVHPDLSPGALLGELNAVLKARIETGMNVTMVIGAIDVETKTLTLANAGHHAHPLRARQGEVKPLKVGGLPLGMRAGINYREEKFRLESGDAVVMMTDGIIEAQESAGRFYAESGRLEGVVSQLASKLSAQALVEAILADAMAFGGEKATRDDDMTVVVVKMK
jgi:serine phosphatase RsbU (regulator of sigma subunit)/ligand-binding sensor domain-containing protein